MNNILFISSVEISPELVMPIFYLLGFICSIFWIAVVYRFVQGYFWCKKNDIDFWTGNKK